MKIHTSEAHRIPGHTLNGYGEGKNTGEPLRSVKMPPPSVIWRLIRSLSCRAGSERGLLVTLRSTSIRRRVRGSRVTGWIIVAYTNLAHSLAVSLKCKHSKHGLEGKGEICFSLSNRQRDHQDATGSLIKWGVLTQVPVEKKEKVTTARAASAITAVWVVWDHWLARKQKHTNHRNVHTPDGEKQKSQFCHHLLNPHVIPENHSSYQRSQDRSRRCIFSRWRCLSGGSRHPAQ